MSKQNRNLPPSNYYWHIALMAVALVLFVGYGLNPQAKLIEFELRQADFSAYKIAEAQTVSDSVNSEIPSEIDTIPDPIAALPPLYVWPIDTTNGQRILLIGDSMNERMRLRMNEYCHKNGYDLQCVIWYSSSTKQYGSTDTLAYFIRQYQPTYVLLNLGANELFIKDIKTKRQGYVEHILTQIGNLPFVWIGPPNWKDDTGINDLIRDNVGRGRYYESRRLTLERSSDGAHPTQAAANQWCDSVAVFLNNEARVPLTMEWPDTLIKRNPKTTLLKLE